jgi:hypothetical protein
MTFKFPCPHCGQRIAATLEDCGTEGFCPTCANTFTVPDAPDPDTPPPIPESDGVPESAPGRPGRLRKVLMLLLIGLLAAGGVAAFFLWPHRSPAAVASKMYEDAIRRLVTADSKPSLEGMDKDMEAMRKKKPDELEMMKKAKIEVTGTTHYGSIAAVTLRVTHPEEKRPPITQTVYARKTWLGWKVDMATDTQIRKDLLNAKQISVAIQIYRHDNGGNLPKDLQELLPKYLGDAKLLLSPLAPGSTEPGYEYFGGPDKDLKPADRLLQGKFPALDGTRAVSYGDGRTVRE